MKKQISKKNQKNRSKTLLYSAKTPVTDVVSKYQLSDQHQTIGNHGMLRRFPGVIQAKLTISDPGDKYEQEADRVAEQVMRMPEPEIRKQPEEEDEGELIQTKPINLQTTPLVQRQAEETIEEEEGEDLIQTKSASNRGSKVTPDQKAKINAMRGSGQPLSKSARAFFEPRFGYDFSKVRVHDNYKAIKAANLVNARAFTIGQNIVFGSGFYTPDTTKGRRLIAHELVHVVQQSNTQKQQSILQKDRKISEKTGGSKRPRSSTWEQARKLVPKEKAAHWYAPWIREVTYRKGGLGHINFKHIFGRKWNSGWRENILDSAVIAMTASIVTAVLLKKLSIGALKKYWQIATGVGGAAAGARTLIGIKAQEKISGSVFLGHEWYGKYRVNVITGKIVAVDFWGKGKDRWWIGSPLYYQQRIVDNSGKILYIHPPYTVIAKPSYTERLPERSYGKFD